MSAETQSYVIKNSPYRGVPYTIHIILGDLANDQNDYKIWMSQANVAPKARTTRKTVQDTFARMCEDGYLELIEDNSKKDKPNVYRFLMPGVTTGDTSCNDSSPEVSREVTRGVTTGDTNSIEHNVTTQENSKNSPASQDGFFDTTVFTPPTPLKAPSKYSEDFEKMWKGYPNGLGKKKAFDCWKTRLKEGATVEELTRAAINYAWDRKMAKTETKYIKHAATFFGPGEWWKDYLVRSVDWKDPRQNVDTDREGESSIIDPKDLYRNRKDHNPDA